MVTFFEGGTRSARPLCYTCNGLPRPTDARSASLLRKEGSLNLFMTVLFSPVGEMAIAVVDNGWFGWPWDIEKWVVITNTAGGGWMIEFGHEIGDFGVVGEGKESMGKACGDVEKAPVIGGEFGAKMFIPGWGKWADVEDDVVDSAGVAADDFTFAVGSVLEVEPAQGMFVVVEGDACLLDVEEDAFFGELFDAECSGEIAALVILFLHS